MYLFFLMADYSKLLSLNLTNKLDFFPKFAKNSVTLIISDKSTI